jgi:hypothetical protein
MPRVPAQIQVEGAASGLFDAKVEWHHEGRDGVPSLADASTIQQQDSAERALNKLARTFITQVEALKRHRTGGQQKVTVEHVHVHEGGQAIVGTVEHKAKGGADKKE